MRQKPAEKPNSFGGDRGTVMTHPAFAVIKAHRVTGRAELFGSDMSHDRYITISISRADMNRHLSSNWIHDRGEIIEVALSEAQWASFISSMNVGVGVPCTIAHVEGKCVPQIERDTRDRDVFAQELCETLEKAQEALADLAKLATGKPLKAAESQAIHVLAMKAQAAVRSSVPFVVDQFNEHMIEKTEAAKSEVHAMAMQVMAGVPLVAKDEPKMIEHDE